MTRIREIKTTFTIVLAVTWAVQMIGIAYVMVFETEKSGVVMSGMSSLSGIWAVALSVLGIYVYKRSEEKRNAGPETIFWNRSQKP